MAKEIKFQVTLTVNGKEQLVTATTDLKELQKTLQDTKSRTKQLSDGFIYLNQRLQTFKTVVSSLQDLGSTFADLTEESRAFSLAMRQTNTLAGKDEAGFEKMRDQVNDLAQAIPMAREELAKGLYNVISADMPEENWMAMLKQSAKASIGSMADLGEIVSVTATIVKNYGMAWSEAGKIQDKIQLTAKNGETTFAEMAQALPRLTANAASLGVQLDELMGAFATLTGVSGNTAEVSTQLAAVLNALIKPSSEATKMAKEMGIQFDAAAVKAAGGFSNFLAQIDRDVQAYSAKTGILTQEVYGRLFGSAEALRALVPLTGQLKDTYTRNVEEMANSTGTLDAAYEQMANTGAAKSQELKNRIGEAADAVNKLVGPYLPIINTLAPVMVTLASVGTTLYLTFKSLAQMQLLQIGTTKAGILTMKLWRATSNYVVTGNVALASSSTAAAAGFSLLKSAIRGLMVATGVGILIAALTMGVEALFNALDKSGDKTKDFSDGLTDAERVAKQTSETFKQTAEQTYGSLMSKYNALQTAWRKLGTAHERAAWIRNNQSAFKDLGLSINSVADAENAFVRNTGRVVEALKRRAEATAYEGMLTDLYKQQYSLESRISKRNRETQERRGLHAGDVINPGASYFDRLGSRDKYVNNAGQWTITEEGAKKLRFYSNSPAQQQDRAALSGVKGQIGKVSARLATLTSEQTPAANRPTPTTPATHTGRTGGGRSATAAQELKEILNPLSENDYNNNIRYYEEQKAKVDMTSAAYAEWNKKLEKTKASLRSLTGEDKGKELIAEPKSVKDYETNLSILEDRQKEATSPETYKQLQQQKEATIKEMEAFKASAAEQYTPGAVAQLRTMDELEKALDYYQQKQNTQTGDELANTQRVINALNKKKQTLLTGMELPALTDEANEINGLSKKEYEVKVKSMGFDELTDKIKNLRELLDNPDSNLTDNQRREVEALISAYEKWRKDGINTFDTIKSGWNGVQGIGDGIKNLSSALQGNGDAWQTLTGVVNSFIQIAEGIKTIVNIIDMLTLATKQQTTAKAAETTVTAAGTAATVTDTAASAANTATKSGEAIAGATKSGANLPFPANIAAIAVGVAAVVAALAMISGFAEGGIVGGSSTQGDKVIARVNSGEMILNRNQQRTLWNLINGNALVAYSPRMGAQTPTADIQPDYGALRLLLNPPAAQPAGNVRFEIDGRKLVGVLANETRVNGKSGRRTNIKI